MNAPLHEYSVVIPVFNESENVIALAREIKAALQGLSHEIIFVDDGSTDDTAAVCENDPSIRLIRHEKNMGQSAAVLTGIRNSLYPWIITLDGDGQNDPADLPKLIDSLTEYDAVVAVRANRNDTLWRRFGSRLAFHVRNLVVGDGIIDIGCGLRVFPRHVALAMPPFNGLHRLMPALFVFSGLKVAQIPTRHRQRISGVSKYGNIKRGSRGLLDLAGLFWLKRRILPIPKEPME